MSEYNNENIFSKRLRAGKRRTYFFDVRTTKNNDYFVTLTESKKRYDGEGYERHKIFLYKEDFNKFLEALNETIDHVKTDLMPDFDFDAFNHEYDDDYQEHNGMAAPASVAPAVPMNPSLLDHKDETAEELSPTIENTGGSNISDVENPTSNDEAETW